MGAFFKMSWMLWWRLSVLWFIFDQPVAGVDVLAPPIVAGILAFGAKKTILAFPLIRLIFLQPVIQDRFTDWTWPATKEAREERQQQAYRARRAQQYETSRDQQNQYQSSPDRTQHRTYRPDRFKPRPRSSERLRPKPTQPDRYRRKTTPPNVGPQIQGASRNGQMTGYEPKALRSVQEVISVNAHGVAGLGLFDAGFDSNNVYTGQAGEINFYKALCKDELIDNFSSFWSVSLPAQDFPIRPATDYTTDIDCIIASGPRIYLLDLKNYASGDVTWYSRDGEYLLCQDTATGSQVYQPRKMSRNMLMALERFRTLFPQHHVEAYVVMMPTYQGAGMIEPGTAFPGNIEVVGVTDILSHLRSLPPETADDETIHAIDSLRQ